MATCLFAYPDRTIPNAYVAPTLTGGSWLDALPLVNIQDPDLSTPARSTDCQAASTQFNVDLGVDRDIRVLAILRHNLSLDATVRVRFWSDTDRTQLVYDTDALAVGLPYYPEGSLPWGGAALWAGMLSDEDRNGYPFDLIRAFTDPIIARYVTVEVTDTANPDGYVQFSRCLLSPAWEPPDNISYGATVGWDTDTTSDRTPGGKRFYNERSMWRTTVCKLESLAPDVAMACVMEMQRRLGLSGELLFVFDPDDDSQVMWQRSFLCTLEELSPIEYPYYHANTAAFKLVEVL